MDTEKIEVIKKWLQEFNRIPTSRFMGLTGWEYNNLKKLLDEMETEGLVIKEEETNATYWKLKDGEKNVI